MRKLTLLFVGLLAFCALNLLVASSAMALSCSVRAKKGIAPTDLQAAAKVSKDQAQATAIASLKSKVAPEIAEGEIELEQGCVVYSFDLRVPGKAGITEVIVDAGTGKILSHKHESARAEAAEKAKDKSGKP